MTDKFDKIPPNNTQAEMSVLGSILIDKDSFYKIDLDYTDFYNTECQKVFKAMQKLTVDSKIIDLVSITEVNKTISSVYLVELMETVHTSSLIEQHANIVKKDSINRQVLRAGEKVTALAHDDLEPEEVLSQAISFISSVDATQRRETSLGTSIYEHVCNIKDKGTTHLLQTGFYKFDDLMGGMKPGGAYVIAARPAQGKTALAINFAYNIAKTGKSVGIISLEMKQYEVETRLLSISSGMDGLDIDKGNIDLKDLQSGLNGIKDLKIHCNDSKRMSINNIRLEAKRMKMEYNIDCLIIDQLSLISGKGNPRERFIENTREIKIIAMELDIPVIELAQTSRGSKPGEVPNMSHLKESGSIEEDADMVMFIHYQNRDEDNPTSDEPEEYFTLIIDKNRHGPTGQFSMHFTKATQKMICQDEF